MYSIYHFFKSLIDDKGNLAAIKDLEKFSYDSDLLSCSNKGQFPDMAIKISPRNPLFTGGELIELKDSKTYNISSFNSTIPLGEKAISEVIKNENSLIKRKMEEAGDDIYSLPIRDVYYLVRGRKKDKIKISKVRNVERASVKLRFRIMTEVKAEGNILNPQKYPQIKDNTINLVVPCNSDEEESLIMQRISAIYNYEELKKFTKFKLKHHFNGYFLGFQIELYSRKPGY
jgi:hypothetical protein